MPIQFLTHDIPSSEKCPAHQRYEARLIAHPTITSGWCLSIDVAFSRINMLRQGKTVSDPPHGMLSTSDMMAAYMRTVATFSHGASDDDVAIVASRIRAALAAGPNSVPWSVASTLLCHVSVILLNPQADDNSDRYEL